MVAIIGVGSKGQNSTSSEHGLVAYQIKCKYFARRPPSPPPTLGRVEMVKNQLFQNRVIAYQIKGNHKCSNMVANILPVHPLPSPLTLGVKMSNSTFLEHGHVAYQIKGNEA